MITLPLPLSDRERLATLIADDDAQIASRPQRICEGWPTRDVHPPLVLSAGTLPASHSMCHDCELRMWEALR